MEIFMRLITDWHIHSKYSRACSEKLVLPVIAKACERKGIDVVATADWTHPAWFAHIKECLEEKEPGLFCLKDRSSKTRFMLVTELSQIYKRDGKTHRVHNLIFAPSLEAVERVNAIFATRNFNLKSDGRPILGIDSENLYKLLKEIDDRIVLIPEHAWTPWYSVFGSKSGFDSLEECFGEMTPYIYAIETGLSSDPAMNWQLSALDQVVLISNSDAHSPRNLGREANVFEFETPPTFDEFARVLAQKDTNKFKYTIEFYPQEGKYHFDGCANCHFSSTPKESKRLGGRCPTCKRPLTLGVHNRIEELADRQGQTVKDHKITFKSIVPLAEILAEVFGVKSTQSKKVEEAYHQITNQLGNEFTILLDAPLEIIQTVTSNTVLAHAIERMRTGQIHIEPGYDGLYGKVRLFGDKDSPKPKQSNLL